MLPEQFLTKAGRHHLIQRLLPIALRDGALQLGAFGDHCSRIFAKTEPAAFGFQPSEVSYAPFMHSYSLGRFLPDRKLWDRVVGIGDALRLAHP